VRHDRFTLRSFQTDPQAAAKQLSPASPSANTCTSEQILMNFASVPRISTSNCKARSNLWLVRNLMEWKCGKCFDRERRRDSDLHLTRVTTWVVIDGYSWLPNRKLLLLVLPTCLSGLRLWWWCLFCDTQISFCCVTRRVRW
jgi:hypothetical protein